MAQQSNTPNTGKTPSGSPATSATTAAPPASRRSGLTGHLRPAFWRMRPATVTLTTSPSAPAAAPGTATNQTPTTPARTAFGRWWQNQLHRNQSIDRATWLVICCALLSLGIYLYAMVRLPLGPNLSHGYQDIGQLTSLTPGGAYNPVVGEVFLVAIALLFGAWSLVYWIAGRAEYQTKTGWWRAPLPLSISLFGFPLAALLVLLFMYPITASDVLDYTSQIRVLTIYHANPLTIAPINFPNDPFLKFNPWYIIPASYGPLWAVLAALVSLPAGNNIFAAVLAQKLLSIVACLGCMIAVWQLARQHCPERRWQAFVFFAWNPLILFEVGANGHNDTLMVFFLLVGLWALLAKRWYWQSLAIPLLVASVLVKWTSILLLPLAIIYLLRGGRARRWGLGPLGLGTLLTAAYAIPLVMPFIDLQHPLGVLGQASQFTTSPPALLKELLEPIYGPDNAGIVAQVVGLALFALIYLFLLARFAFPGPRERLEHWERPTPSQRLIAAAMESYFWYFVLATFWFQPWYLIALVPLAALDARPLARTRGALFSLGAPLKYIVYIFLLVIFWWHIPPFTTDLTACVVVYGLPLFTRLLESWQARQRLYDLLAQAHFSPAPAAAKAPRRRKSWWLT
jgi:hypothetical protein